MKRCIAVLVMLLPFAVAADVKIGYIDSNRILEEYKGKGDLKDRFEEELANWQKEAVAKKQSIENMVKEFESQSLMLSEDARARKRKEIEKAQVEYEGFVQSIFGAEGSAKKRNDEIMKPFIEQVNVILQEIGKDRKYTMILDAASTGIVYVKEGMDLTDEVVAELNKEFAPTISAEEKVYFWVFEFKEDNQDARDWDLGKKLQQHVKAGFIQSDKFKEPPTDRFKDALVKASINKDEQEFLPEDAARVGQIAEIAIVVIGKVTKLGDKVDITCTVVEAGTGRIITEEIANSETAETDDISNMVQRVMSKLIPAIDVGE